MRGLLLYNPQAGRNREARAALIERIAATLRSSGYGLEIAATTHRGSASSQTRAAIAAGAQVVFACGGDGTVHDVLQGIVGTDAKLAIIPLGSANALCREFGIPQKPLKAAAAYAKTSERSFVAGVCRVGEQSHYFLSMAGAGPDGALMYRMLTVNRGRWGRWAYAMHALRLLIKHRFQPFEVRYLTREGMWHSVQAVSAMVLRIGNLGGVFPGIAKGVTAQPDCMRLIVITKPAWLSLPLWFACAWLRLERRNPFLMKRDVDEFACSESGSPVYAQADGEYLGKLPMHVALEQQPITLLLPQT
jgi:diacylglycerol kinase family enzyme